MKQTVNFYDFERAFVAAGRGEQFSYAGKKALFDYLEDMEESIGEEIELDVIAFCCEYSEYNSLVELYSVYENVFIDRGVSFNIVEIEDEEKVEDEMISLLREHTEVISFDEGYIIQEF